jgi:hypothetical protein
LATVVTGAIGYLIVEFYYQPILRYRQVRSKVVADLVFYANALRPMGPVPTPGDRFFEGKEANRRSASDLEAALEELPTWYKKWLSWRGERPDDAVSELIGLSNSGDVRDGHIRVRDIHRLLRLRKNVTWFPKEDAKGS